MNKRKQNNKVKFNLGANKVIDLSKKEISQCTWHTVEELKNMREEARKICKQMTSNDVTKFRDVTTCVDASNSGLEAYICNERHRRRKLTIKCILKYQNRLADNVLSELYRHMSEWAYNLAYFEAEQDHKKVTTKEDEHITRMFPVKGIVL